jgi:phosphatidylglycerol:prolipoprotein diacylglycerol transferase
MYPYMNIFGSRIEFWLIFTTLGYIAALIGMLSTRPDNFFLSRGKISLCAVTYLFAGIIGAILLSFLIHPESHEGLSGVHALGTAGTAYLGEPLLGLLALWILSRWMRFSFIGFVDFGMVYIMLARAISRIGCIFAGCCYGIPTTLPWGFRFLADGIMRHPTQAYAMACAFGLFGSARFIYKKLGQFKGLTFFYLIFMYSFLRFFNEFLRQEGPRIAGQLKLIHPFLLLFMVIGIIGTFKAVKSVSSEQKVEIKKAFSGALLRLLIWMLCSAIFPLTIIYIANRIWP